MRKWRRLIPVIVILALLAALIPGQIASAATCGVIGSGTLAGPGNASFGPADLVPGSVVLVRVTNTSLVTVNYTVVLRVGPVPIFTNSGTVSAGETETAAAPVTAAISLSADVTIDGGTIDYAGSVSCPSEDGTPAEAPPAITDGRLLTTITLGAVYVSDGTIQVWAIGDDGQGEQALFISKDELASLPDKPEENILIASSPDGKYSVYKLTTGEYQVNMGPDAEGKIKVIIFDDIPPSKVYGYEIVP